MTVCTSGRRIPGVVEHDKTCGRTVVDVPGGKNGPAAVCPHCDSTELWPTKK